MLNAVTITLTIDEINNILNALGGMPTNANVWPTMTSLREKAEKALNEQAAAQPLTVVPAANE